MNRQHYPEEVLDFVLSFLDEPTVFSVRLVCRHWKRLAEQHLREEAMESRPFSLVVSFQQQPGRDFQTSVRLDASFSPNSSSILLDGRLEGVVERALRDAKSLPMAERIRSFVDQDVRQALLAMEHYDSRHWNDRWDVGVKWRQTEEEVEEASASGLALMQQHLCKSYFRWLQGRHTFSTSDICGLRRVILYLLWELLEQTGASVVTITLAGSDCTLSEKVYNGYSVNHKWWCALSFSCSVGAEQQPAFVEICLEHEETASPSGVCHEADVRRLQKTNAFPAWRKKE